MYHENHIYVVDRDPQLQGQIRHLAREADATWTAYDDAESLLADLPLRSPACLIINFDLEGMSGLQLQQELRRRRIAIPIVFAAEQPRVAAVVQAMKQGAQTVLDKPVTAGKLLSELDHALTHAQNLLRIDARHAVLRDRLSRLTLKEKQVLDLVMVGKPNKVIARRLGVSLRTVEVRRQNIFRKTETRSVAELVQLVIAICGNRQPLVEPGQALVPQGVEVPAHASKN